MDLVLNHSLPPLQGEGRGEVIINSENKHINDKLYSRRQDAKRKFILASFASLRLWGERITIT
jgi:hypothetical protein